MSALSGRNPATRRRAVAGVTLIELIIVMAMMVVITGALGYGFAAGIDMQRRHTARLEERDRVAAMEQRIAVLIQGAKLNEDATDTHSYFQGIVTGTNASDLGCDRLTFTTAALGVPDSARYSQDDFETQQNAHGPVGGISEVSLGTTPVGTPNDSQASGLFERVQTPADGDATQGGTESLLLPDVSQIGFQFWDGLEWTPTWDTVATVHRLPTAVQVSYTLGSAGNNATVRTFVVPIPASDIDAQNPAAGAGATTTLGGGG